MNWLVLGAAVLTGYLLGSIPFGLVVSRATGAVDPRTVGSGNIGATNVLRTGNKKLAALTLLLDAVKGMVAVWLVQGFWPDPDHLHACLAGAAAFIGHVYPVWLRFKGGKGVATMLGLALALYWPCGLVFAVVWLLTFSATRQSSVGGMSAAVATPVAAAVVGRSDLALVFLLLAMIVLFKHRANIDRLLDGTEPRFGTGKG